METYVESIPGYLKSKWQKTKKRKASRGAGRRSRSAVGFTLRHFRQYLLRQATTHLINGRTDSCWL